MPGSKAMEHGAGQRDFISAGTPSRDTGLISLARTLDDDASVFLGWLLEAWEKQGLTPSEPEMPELLWQKLKEDTERLREVPRKSTS